MTTADSRTIDAADFFAGAGGSSTGLYLAASEAGIHINLTAVNHNAKALAAHQANFPWGKHLLTGVQNVVPEELAPEGRLNILVASPECKYYSRARGGKPVNDQERVSAWYLEKFIRRLEIQSILIENVPEFMNWGPLVNGYPDKDRYGEIFRKWTGMFRRYGYNLDYRIVNAADYGDATTRRRFFMLAKLGEDPIVWPQPTHNKEGTEGMDRWVPAGQKIDLTNLGKSIFDRKRPLCENTMKRIFAGLRKFGGPEFEPFIVMLEHSKLEPEQRVRSIHLPLNSITTAKGGAHAIVYSPFLLPVEGYYRGNLPKPINEPVGSITQRGYGSVVTGMLSAYHGGSPNRNYSLEGPSPTVDASNRLAYVKGIVYQANHNSKGRSLDEPCPTLTGVNKLGLVDFLITYYKHGGETSINDPAPTVTAKDRIARVMVRPRINIDGTIYELEILYRMLTPEELAAIMGFPQGYKFVGNRVDKVKQIGNAVAVNTAKALISSLLKRSDTRKNLMEAAY